VNRRPTPLVTDRPFDVVALRVFGNLFSSLADEMGIVLMRSAFSPNIKVRRDYSCAVFDPQGRLLAQAAHIPVHLGAMPLAMEAVRQRLTLGPEDVVILNDPFAGGTHLPDISLVSPAYHKGVLLGYLMSRAHHSDVGGMTPASMPLSRELFQEGLILPPVKLVEQGVLNREVMTLISRNVRTPVERQGDLAAQLAAQASGRARFTEIASRYGIDAIETQSEELIRYAELMTRGMIRKLKPGQWMAEDHLDDNGFDGEPVAIRAQVEVPGDDRLRIDFSGSAPQQPGPINAVEAVTRAALLYVIRVLIDEDVPVNAGMLHPLHLHLPEGSVVCARPPAAVSAGNVETSQRIVDVLFRCFAQAMPGRVPAASQGTMNNVTFGGWDASRNAPFAYYETLGGGMGARPWNGGMSGVHDHMSNTRNTPVEELESQYPVRVCRYELRRGSGGKGAHRGGNGIRRDIEFLSPATASLITERRSIPPYGLSAGGTGAAGRNLVIRGGTEIPLPGKAVIDLQSADVLSIRTPGGGGFGKFRTASESA